MGENKSIKELKELLDLMLTGVEVGVDITKDGKLDLNDLQHVMKLIPVVGPAVQNIGDIPAELGDLSSEEGTEIVVHVMTKLAVDDAKAKIIIEKSLKAALAVYELVKAISEPAPVAA